MIKWKESYCGTVILENKELKSILTDYRLATYESTLE